MERLFDELVIMATNERLDNILNKDKGFLEVQEKTARAIKLFEELELTEEQQLIVDRMVSHTMNLERIMAGWHISKKHVSADASEAHCEAVGVYDCVEILKEMGIL